MGKRKERRIAMAASRRVKLDIFAEPPGDPGGFPTQDELGGDTNTRHRDGSPNSPSSSGKQPENPLLLLGQYSDEEGEEQSSQQSATLEKISAVDSEQVNGLMVAENENTIAEGPINLDAPNDKEHVLDEYEPGQIDATGAESVSKEVVSVEATSHSGSFDVQPNVDANTGWKVVLHEESGQYYYWNTVTGETSWVVPDVLATESEMTGGREAAPDAEKSSSPLTVVEQTNPALYVELKDSSAENIGHHSIASERTDELEEKNEPGSQMQAPVDESKNGLAEDTKEAPDVGQTGNDLGNGLCSSVLRHGENLLERFKTMEGSRNKMEGNDWIARYILEVEIRLADAKSLLSFGSSLLPFWAHCEKKLKDLEAAFNAEVCRFFIDETQAVEAADASPASEGNDTETDKKESSIIASDIEKPCVSSYVDKSTVLHQDEQNEAACSSVLAVEHVNSIECLKPHLESSLEVNTVGSETARIFEFKPETMLQNEVDEDVDMDMDVDMEVEDAKEQNFPPNPPVGSISYLPPEKLDVPPPPGEDWIPPPPPDSEPVPPPPPDSEPVPPPPPDDSANSFYPQPPPSDQTEPSYPTYSQTVQPLSYSEQYGYTYPNSTFEYYGQTGTLYPASSLYQQAVTAPNPPAYYETLPSYPGAAPILVTPVESVAHYDVQDGAVTHGSVITTATSSGLLGESCPGAIGSDNNSSLNLQAEISHASLSDARLDVSAVNGGIEKEPKGTLIAQTPVSVANSVIESGPVLSVPAATMTSDVAKSAITTVQSKVMRSKKRAISAAPTLRSNKKVSSMVDKWKAAKEELHEEEDEPESAYDILEKKRQREIEKWRKQQIASGEAKENANFQPLGGDWRERVKRKRAQLEKEDRKSPSEDTTDKNKQPDLDNLSRDLPAGWQVYWDESSKQVYYGNTITSETTWTRPEK